MLKCLEGRIILLRNQFLPLRCIHLNLRCQIHHNYSNTSIVLVHSLDPCYTFVSTIFPYLCFTYARSIRKADLYLLSSRHGVGNAYSWAHELTVLWESNKRAWVYELCDLSKKPLEYTLNIH